MLDANDRGPADRSVDELEHTYGEAVSVGGVLSPWSTPEERLRSPLELLAQITIHTPQLALILVELARAGKTAPEHLAREARRFAAFEIRLAHRALEVHARDVGYELDAWRHRAVLEASAALTEVAVDCGSEPRVAASGLVVASAALAGAITAVPTDRMAVPGHLASAIGGLLTCYVRPHPLEDGG